MTKNLTEISEETINHASETQSPCPGAEYGICGLHERLPQEERDERCYRGLTCCYVHHIKIISTREQL